MHASWCWPPDADDTDLAWLCIAEPVRRARLLGLSEGCVAQLAPVSAPPCCCTAVSWLDSWPSGIPRPSSLLLLLLLLLLQLHGCCFAVQPIKSARQRTARSLLRVSRCWGRSTAAQQVLPGCCCPACLQALLAALSPLDAGLSMLGHKRRSLGWTPLDLQKVYASLK